MLTKLAYLAVVLLTVHHTCGSPCKSYREREECTKAKKTCEIHKTTTPAPCVEKKRDWWCLLQPLLLALYILIAVSLLSLLCSCICRMCNQLFIMCGCDTWFRPCFLGFSESDTSLVSSSLESCPCDNKLASCKNRCSD